MPNSLFKYGFCQVFFVSVLRFLLQIFISKIHVYLPSGHFIVLTFDLLHSFMYIHAIELTVGQLLAFLHVPIRVKFTAYCLLEIIVYISIHLNHAITTSLLNTISIVLFFQYLTSARLLNSLPLFTVCSGVIVIYCCYINRIWLHSTYIFISTFVLLLTLFCLIIING